MENCGGTSNFCPDDGLLSAATTCRESIGICDVTERCNGLTPACPSNEFAAPGSACTADSNLCTDDKCDGGGSCLHANNTANCDDGEFCNGPDSCSGGSCSQHTGNPCAGPDGDINCAETCDEVAETCTADADDSPCDDGRECNGSDSCAAGVCSTHENPDNCSSRPRTAQLIAINGVDPGRPSVVLTHGLESTNDGAENLWTGTGPQQAATLIAQHAEQNDIDVNILQYKWPDGFQPFLTGKPTAEAYKTARVATTDAGESLSEQLVDLLGGDYAQRIHFVGHSLGSIVNAYAARSFLDRVPTVTVAQFTALDRPQYVANGIEGFIADDAAEFGYDEDVFAGILPGCRPGLSLYVDNYFSRDPRARASEGKTGMGERTNGPFYNHRNLVFPRSLDGVVFDTEGARNNNTGVQQWYRWTIDPTLPVGSGNNVCDGSTEIPSDQDPSLNPCDVGWAWSVSTNGETAFPEQAPCQPDESPKDLGFELQALNGHGCTLDGVGAGLGIVCEHAGAPSSSTTAAAGDERETLLAEGSGTLQIPDSAVYLQFDFEFDGGEDAYAEISVDDTAIWTLNASTDAEFGSHRTPPIPLGGRTGDRSFKVSLFGRTGVLSQFSIDNLSLVETPVCGDGQKNTGELCDTETVVTGSSCGKTCGEADCGDPNKTMNVSATDALFVLKAAVGIETCVPIVCDVNSSGSISASDALLLLRYSVGTKVGLCLDPAAD